MEQATKSLITYSELVVFPYCLRSFRIALAIPLVSRYLHSLDVKGTFEGTSYGHRRQLVGGILAHSKGLSSFFVGDNRGSRSCIRRRHRGSYDLCIEGTMMIYLEGNGARIPLRSRDMTIYIRKGNERELP